VVSILRVLVATLQLYETTIVTNIHNGLQESKPLWNKILYL
jgi:hypothetical protein